jgi:hypothetical protein
VAGLPVVSGDQARRALEKAERVQWGGADNLARAAATAAAPFWSFSASVFAAWTAVDFSLEDRLEGFGVVGVDTSFPPEQPDTVTPSKQPKRMIFIRARAGSSCCGR